VIVRELLTLLGFTVDKASYDKASKTYDSMADRAVANAKATKQAAGALGHLGQQAQQAARGSGMLGQALGMVQRFSAQAGISHLLKQYTTLASDANETRGALTQLFGEDQITAVEKWSEVQGAAMGRSKYDLQTYAARLGSVLGPVTESREEAQKMAQSLSELSVDLASFFNTRDEDAMAALRAGLTGEMESLKRYGIVVNEATLLEVAQKQGIKKKVTQMTVAEKTQLRYAAIVARSSAAQGDAVRTSEGMANSTKALKAQLKTLGIDAAKKVVPVIEKFVRIGRDAAAAFVVLAGKSNVLESAMWTLAAVAGVLALEFYGAFILPAIGVLALIVVVDELITLFRGGKTVVGEFFNMFAGAGKADEYIRNLAAGFQILNEEMGTAWSQFRATWGDTNLIKAIFVSWDVILEDLGIRFGDWLTEVFLKPLRAIQGVLRAIGINVGPDLASYERASGRDLGAGVETTEQTRYRRFQERVARSGGAPTEAGFGTGLNQRQYATGRQLGAGTLMGGAGATTAAPAAVGARAAPAAGGGAVVVPVSTAAPTIHIHGGDSTKIRRVILDVLNDKAKAEMAAAGGKGRS